MSNIAMEDHHFQWINHHESFINGLYGLFSVAMWNTQKVFRIDKAYPVYQSPLMNCSTTLNRGLKWQLLAALKMVPMRMAPACTMPFANGLAWSSCSPTGDWASCHCCWTYDQTCCRRPGLGQIWHQGADGPNCRPLMGTSKNCPSYGCVWKCCVPIVPNDFADHYPVFKWLFHWEYTQHFQTNPYCLGEYGRVVSTSSKTWRWAYHVFQFNRGPKRLECDGSAGLLVCFRVCAHN